MVLEKTLESPLDCKEIQPAHSKGDQSWVFIGRTDVEAETPILWSSDAKSWLTHLKRPWGWERLRAGGERDNRGWDNWMASPTQRTWVWVNSGSWWWTGRPGVLGFMGSQSQTWLSNWTELNCIYDSIYWVLLECQAEHLTTSKAAHSPLKTEQKIRLGESGTKQKQKNPEKEQWEGISCTKL